MIGPGSAPYSGYLVRSLPPPRPCLPSHREEFQFDHHCGGLNLDATPNDIIRRIKRYSDLRLAEASRSPTSTVR